MTRYVYVSSEPNLVQKDEIVIRMPQFIDEIKECAAKKPRNGLSGPNYLREVVAKIGFRYLGQDFDPYIINISNSVGIPIPDEVAVSKIVLGLFARYRPEIFEAYLDHQIKNRPRNTKLIWFVGDHTNYRAFFLNGIDQIDFRDIEVYMGRKVQKTVGRPAVKDNTDE